MNAYSKKYYGVVLINAITESYNNFIKKKTNMLN